MVEICEELHKKGNSFFSEGKYQQAIDSYKECLENVSDDRKRQQVVNRNLAQCYLNLNKYNEAVQAANKALCICPTDTKALYRRSLAYEKLGELKESIVDAKKLIQLEPNNKAIRDLIRRVELCVIEKKEFAQSLKGRVDSMYSILTDEKSDNGLIEKALLNMIALVKDEGKTAANTVWSHSSSQKLFDLTKHGKTEIANTALLLLEKIAKAVPSLGVAILDKLTNKYIFGRVLSPNADVSVEMCKFLSHILESITEIKAYKKAYDAAIEAAKRDKTQVHTFFPKDIYPAYRLDPSLEARVQELLAQIVRASNSYRLEAAARDVLIQTLTWLIPTETGIGWSKRFINTEGNVERLLEVAAATCPAAAVDRSNPDSSSSSRKRLLEETSQAEKEAGLPEISRGGLLKTSPNTRLIVACLLSRLFNDLRSDQDRQHFCQVCVGFVITPKSLTKIKSPKFLRQCNHIRTEPKLIFLPKRSALVDDNCKEPEKIGLAKPVSFADGKDLMCSQTEAPWSRFDPSLGGPLQGTSYLILVDSYSKLPEVIFIESATTGTVVNVLRQVFTKVIVFGNVSSPPNFNGQDEQLVYNVKRQFLIS
ncbi:hypothetical protein ACTXT7_007742 [Hymenolepis weldensis]